MMTHEQVERIALAITYKPGWLILVREDSWDSSKRLYIQIEVTAESDDCLSPYTHKREPFRSRKHYLSPHMCRQEIVGAVYGAIEAAEMHEMREWFRYKNASIYNPHLDPDVLVEVARARESFSVRDDAMSMKED